MNNIQRVYMAHTLNAVAGSIISVYVPIYLLTLGFTLQQVIFYYVISHGVGVTLGLLLYVPLMRKWGLINTFKLYYPLQILFLLLLFLLHYHAYPMMLVAIIEGAATYAYWMPLNLLFIRNSQEKEMGSNLGKFYALPKLFGILGPLIGAVLIPFVGFWPVFVLTAMGIVLSYLPLAKIVDGGLTVSLNFSKAWKRISRNKSLFVFEGFDNIIEESEWFWPIYVFLVIGSLSTPGLIGSLEAVGGALFTFFIGKYANRHDKKLIPIAALLLLGITFLKIFVTAPLPAYIITVAASFVMTLFLVSYFSTIYRTIKNDEEEEFIILREIPTVLGRMVVFGAIYLTASHLHYFFIAPIIFIVLLLLLYMLKNKSLKSV